MAFVYDPNLQDEEKKSGNQPENPNQPPTGPSISGQAAPSAAGGQAPPQKQPSSRQFVNLQSYLDANQGKNFGKQVGSRVDENTNAARQQTQQAADSFGQSVERGTTRYDKDFVTGALSDPSGFVANRPASEYERFSNMRDAEYKGPQSSVEAPEFAQAASSADRAFRQGENLKSEPGRFALLDEFFSRPTYSRGEKSLDNLLLQADPENQRALEAATANTRNLPSEFQAASSAANAQANAGRAATEQARAETRAALGGFGTGTGAIGEAEKGLDEKLARLKAERDAGIASFDNDWKSKTFWADNPNASAEMKSWTYGVDPKQFQTIRDADTKAIASPEERAKLAALAKLAGNDVNPYETSEAPVDSLYSFDKNAFWQAQNKAQNEHFAAAYPIRQKYGSIQDELNWVQQNRPEAVGGDWWIKKNEQLKDLAFQYSELNKKYKVNVPIR